jgi:hypothetical protein
MLLHTGHEEFTSALTARVEGEVQFASGLLLHITEFLDFRMGRILDYSYTVLRNEECIRRYVGEPETYIFEAVA